MLLWAAWACVDAGEVALKDAPRLVLRAVRGGLGAAGAVREGGR